jgi:hypothetical protein
MLCYKLIEEGETMVPLGFDYEPEEIVQMAGVGPLSLKSALKRMPDRIDERSVLYRDLGKNPTFFNAEQIEALRARYRLSDEGKRPGHPQANDDDF